MLLIEVVLSWDIMGCLSKSGRGYNLEKFLESCFNKIDKIHVIVGITHIKQLLFPDGQSLVSYGFMDIGSE